MKLSDIPIGISFARCPDGKQVQIFRKEDKVYKMIECYDSWKGKETHMLVEIPQK